jgi:asparagine synthase (glutamine-hydrolysing)
MCGIAGIAGRTPDPERAALVRRMCERLVHRGPDGDGFYDGATVSLGMRRLAIIDVAHGEQPFFSEDGLIAAVFNGEIYNFEELRARLISRGHRLRSSCDSECIPHLYEEYGDGFVEHLRGMFAIAIWDGRRDRLLLVRDRLGKKPLYYRADAGGIAFASELKALMVDPRTSREPDPVAIHHYLTLQYVPAPWSILSGVGKVRPGHRLVWDGSGVHEQPYWQLSFTNDGPVSAATPELEEEIRDRLMSAVRDRLVSERPVGAFLSGGLDSSAVVAAMTRVSTGTVKTFSIGFDEEEYNELPHARRVAKLFGTDHHEEIVRPDGAAVMPLLARCFDEPYADASAIPSYYLAKMARKHVVVALNGDGGDEVFGGYRRYPMFLRTTSRSYPAWSCAGVRFGARGMAKAFGSSRLAGRAAALAAVASDPRPAGRYARFLTYFGPERKAALYTPGFAARVAGSDTYDLVADVWDASRATDPINRLLAIDTALYLPGDLLPKVDITTMSVGLEARSPFLDHEFVEFAAGLSGRLKASRRDTKVLLKKSLGPWLPTDLISRQKQGFGVPMAAWLNGPLRDLSHDLLLDDTARKRGLFNEQSVRQLLARHHQAGSEAPRIYALLMLELWFREVLEALPEGPG